MHVSVDYMSFFTIEKQNRKLSLSDFNSAVLYRVDKYDALIVKFFPKIEESLCDINTSFYELKKDGVQFVFHVEGRIITFNVALEKDEIQISSEICSNTLGELQVPIKVNVVNYKKGKSTYSTTSDFEEKRTENDGLITFSRYFSRGKYNNQIKVRIN